MVKEPTFIVKVIKGSRALAFVRGYQITRHLGYPALHSWVRGGGIPLAPPPPGGADAWIYGFKDLRYSGFLYYFPLFRVFRET